MKHRKNNLLCFHIVKQISSPDLRGGDREINYATVNFCVLVVILFINCYSVNLATGVQNVFTAAKLVAILIVILGGMYQLAQGKFDCSFMTKLTRPKTCYS